MVIIIVSTNNSWRQSALASIFGVASADISFVHPTVNSSNPICIKSNMHMMRLVVGWKILLGKFCNIAQIADYPRNTSHLLCRDEEDEYYRQAELDRRRAEEDRMQLEDMVDKVLGSSE